MTLRRARRGYRGLFASASLSLAHRWTHYHEVKQDVLLKVAEIIDRHGAQIAFPTRTLHIERAAEP